MRKIWGDLSKAKHPEAVVYLHNSSLSGLHFATKDEMSRVMAGFAKQQAVAFADFIHRYAEKYGNSWGIYGTDQPIRSTEELYNLFLNETRDKE